MSKQSQASETRIDKRSRPKVKPTVVEELSDDLGLAAESMSFEGLLGASATPPPIDRHAALLGDRRLSHPANTVKRARIVSHLQRNYGNSHVQRVVDLVQADPDRKPSDAVPRLATTWGNGAPSVEIQSPIGSIEAGIRSQIEACSDKGRRVPEPLRSEAETRLGADLADVRIHAGPQVDRLAQDMDALGFTLDNDIFLTSGAAQSPEVVSHELQHAAQQDHSTLYFWTVRPPLATVIRRLVETLAIEPAPSWNQLRGDRGLRPLRRAIEAGPEEARTNMAEFFATYPGGVNGFVNDLATCYERMADAVPSPLAGRHSYVDEQGEPNHRAGARNLFERDIELISFPYEAIGPLGHQRALRIYSPVQARQGQERRPPAREEDWLEYWGRYHSRRTFENPGVPGFQETGDPTHRRSRFIQRMIQNWNSYVDGQGTFGAAANQLVPAHLRWVVGRSDGGYISSLEVVNPSRSLAERTRVRGIGIAYLQEVYSNYSNAWLNLIETAEALEQSLRQGREHGDDADTIRTNIPLWNTLSPFLTDYNRRRLRGLTQCWEDHWQYDRRVAVSWMGWGSPAPCLGQAGIYVASGGGLSHDAADPER